MQVLAQYLALTLVKDSTHKIVSPVGRRPMRNDMATDTAGSGFRSQTPIVGVPVQDLTPTLSKDPIVLRVRMSFHWSHTR